jgi:hypothetical protein
MSQIQPSEPIFIVPLAVTCAKCSVTTPIFDPRSDGYHGEIKSSAGMTGHGPADEFACGACEGRDFDPVVSLQYSLDEADCEESEEIAARPQDFFTSFSLSARCANCGASKPVANYEC